MKKKTVEVAFDPVMVKADTFGEFGKWWYAYYKTKVQATTYESYGYTLAKLIETFGSFRLIDIQAYHIEAFLEAAVLAGLSKSYISKCRSMMGKIMSKAEAYGKISKNPVPLVDTIRINPLLSEKPFSEPFVHKKDAYTVEEVKTLFELLPNDKIGHSIRLMLCSGIRTQELLAMEHKHVAVVFFKQWVYCIGLLIALYLAYVGCDLVWGFYSGKILCYRMVCIKASKVLSQERMYIIMREIGENIDAEDAIHKFYLPVTKRDAALITENTIMNIYIRPENPTQVQAWEIIDYAG